MKQRLDQALVERALVSGRDRAKGLILAGQVYVNGQKADKVGHMISHQDSVEVRGETLAYVSRGGLKLEKAMESFKICLEGKVCADFGASTGGFSDCMLQNGAAKVYAIDVGYGQLAWSIRQDERVVVMERTNVRHLTREHIEEAIDFISMDLSFISLALILPVASELLSEEGEAVCLIKPQFEAGREQVGKKGVVRDANVHVQVIDKVIKCAGECGFTAAGVDYSPVKGPKGNIEYLLHIIKGMNKNTGKAPLDFDIIGLVNEANDAL